MLMPYSRLLMIACCSMLAVCVCAQPYPHAAAHENTTNGKHMPAGKASTQDEGTQHYGNKMILGAEEFVYVKETGATFAARIDTGANYSSLSAVNIKQFERDGKKYVRFDVEANDKKFSAEAVLVKTDTIRQVSSATPQSRLIVKLTVKVGSVWVETEFSLVDRRRMQYPLLLGRTFLKDQAVVDISRAFVQGTPAGSGELILQRDVYLNTKSTGTMSAPQPPRHEQEAQIAYPAHQGPFGNTPQEQ